MASLTSRSNGDSSLSPLEMDSLRTKVDTDASDDGARPETPPLLSPGLSLPGNSAERIFPIRSVKHYRQSTAPPSPSLLRANSSDLAQSPTTAVDSNEHPPASNSLGSRISKDDPEPLMTSRFEHTVLENGDNWIITGHQGKLERCEDEVSFCVRSICIFIHFSRYRSRFAPPEQYNPLESSSCSIRPRQAISTFSKYPKSVSFSRRLSPELFVAAGECRRVV